MIAIAPMIASVAAAFLDWGLRNAGTPLLIASTPVSAVAPEEKAFNSVNRPTVPAAVAASCSGSTSTPTSGHPPAHRDEADAHQRRDRQDEAVGRDREQGAGFARAAQVGERDEDDEHDRQQHAVLVGPRDRRPDREHASHDRDDNGHHVVEEQRRRGRQPGERAEVVLADDVGAAPAGIGAHRLPVRGDDHSHQQRDGDRDRHDVLLRRRRRDEQDDQDLAGGIGDRGQRVGGEDRERQHLRQQRVLQVVTGERTPQDDALDHRRARRSRGRCVAVRHPERQPTG